MVKIFSAYVIDQDEETKTKVADWRNLSIDELMEGQGDSEKVVFLLTRD